MKIIIGLGNPGKEYEKTRHNIGFRAVETLAQSLGGENFRKSRLKADIVLANDGERRIVLAKPVTFMNLSGQAVTALLGFYKRSVHDLLVIHDELDLPLGRLKFAAEGSSGGHKGVESIIESVNTKTFCRLRLGIGRPQDSGEAVDYVLSPFHQADAAAVDEMLKKAVKAVLCLLDQGIDRAMEQYNRRQNE